MTDVGVCFDLRFKLEVAHHLKVTRDHLEVIGRVSIGVWVKHVGSPYLTHHA